MGDTDISRQLDSSVAKDTWRVRTGLVYGYNTSDKTFAGTKQTVIQGGDYDLQMSLLSLTASCEAPTGTGLGFVLPAARIYRHDSERTATDSGIGDLELRFRQEFSRFWSPKSRFAPQLVLSSGVVAPTGPYVGKSTVGDSTQAVATVDTRYTSLGRGVWWFLADLEAFGALAARLGWYAAIWTRTPLDEASNGFRWGAEQRLSIAGNIRIIDKVLSASAGIDWQRRLKASEVLNGERHEFLNGGGDWIDFVPSVRWQVLDDWALSATMRQPLYRNVVGIQGVPNAAYFLGVHGGWNLGAKKSEAGPDKPLPVVLGQLPSTPQIATLVQPGVVTVVDYWATWCKPCLKLGEELDPYVHAHPGVVLKRVEATEWLQEEMDLFLPGCAGLPVIDIFGRDRRLQVRLVGPHAFEYANVIASLLQEAEGAAGVGATQAIALPSSPTSTSKSVPQ